MRTFDHRMLEQIANDPDVRPLLGGEGPINLEPVLANPNNLGFVNQHGGFLVLHLIANIYEVHTIFKPGPNARSAVRLMLKAQEFMFVETACAKLVTKCPTGNDPAMSMAKIGGFSGEGFQKGAYLMGLDLDTWVRTCYRTLEAGRNFHKELEAAKLADGSKLPSHEDDDLHDRMAGAAYLMIKAGNVIKGVNFYNQWAAFAGYQTINALSVNPVVVDIVDAVVGVEEGEMKVMLCR